MKLSARLLIFASLWAATATWAPAQNYPTHKYTPKPKATPTAKETPQAPEASPTPTKPDKPTGPLKMIKTDGKNNKDSPIKVLELNYYDAGFGAKFNTEVRTSCKIENSSKTDELKRVTLILQVVNGDEQSMQEWKQAVGNLKPGAPYTFSAPVWYNSMGIPLHAKVIVEHEEVPKKKK